MSDTFAARAPRIGLLQWLRLWFSYQRYGFLLLSCAALLLAGSWLAWHSPWLTAVAALAAAWPFFFGMTVLARWPEKVRATRVADHRRAAGRFDPSDVRPLCGDPCFRVVANELLVRASVPRAERRRLIAELREAVERENRTGVMIDHTRGIVTLYEDGKSTQYPIAIDPGDPAIRSQ